MAFTVIVVGDPVLASVAMGNWRNVNYGNALLPVDATGNGVNNTIAAGSTSYRFSNTYSVLGNFSGQITSTLITGTAPFSIASTTKVANLNADFLDDQTGSYYQNSDNQSAGTLPSGRLAGAYTGITGLGTIASATTISVSSGSPLTLIGPSGGDNLLNLGNSGHTGFSSVLGYANTSINDNTMLRIAAFQNSSGSAVMSAYVVLAKEGGDVDDKSQIFFGTHDGTSVARRMTIKSSGNVGIGISDPIQKLHIYGTTSNPGILIGDASSRIGIYYDTSVGDSVIYGYYNPGGGDATCIRFKTPSSSGSDKLTLTRDGKILLGAASAQGLLNVPDHTTAAGGLYIGSDVTLYRSAANVLKTDDALVATGGIDAGGNGTTLKLKQISIGDWNMETTNAVNVAHGLSTDYLKIRGIFVKIIHDDGAQFFELSSVATDGEIGGGIGTIDSTNIQLVRMIGGVYDTTNFNSTSFNRGYIQIWYNA